MPNQTEAAAEQYRLTLSNAGKIRNRTEAHMVAFAQALLAEPVVLTMDQLWELLSNELNSYMLLNQSHGWCRISGPNVSSRVMGKPHIVTRTVGIYGKGRGIYTLCISETVQKDALNGYAPSA